jgi:hypothetical protein
MRTEAAISSEVILTNTQFSATALFLFPGDHIKVSIK